MRITLFYDRSVHDNAGYYYQLAKESREKLIGLDKAIEETKKEMALAQKSGKKEVRFKRQKEWFEKYHNARTGGGFLMIGGRNAQQNDQLVSKHMDEGDLFFHADIQGGAVVILKTKSEEEKQNGPDTDSESGKGSGTESARDQENKNLKASEPGKVGEQDLLEAAQFAASFSNAWKNGNASVDVYCVGKAQLTKNVSGGFVPAGAFAILGERRWFKDTRLSLRLGMAVEGPAMRIRLLPDASKLRLKDELVLVPSLAGKEKGAIAKSLAKRFNVHPDELLEILPNGKTKTVQR